MPFLKFSRDKRGYENFYLIEPPSGGRRGGKSHPRLLFWFRSPPQVKVGRAPFSDEVRQMVEAQNPGMTFDWARIMSTPIPPPDTDHWRERRRMEKAAKRAAREDDDVETPAVEPSPEIAAAGEAVTEAVRETVMDAVTQVVTLAATEDVAIHGDDGDDTDADAGAEDDDSVETAPAETAVVTSDAQGSTEAQGTAAPGQRRRRRRRRGRRGRHGQPEMAGQSQPQAQTASEAVAPQAEPAIEPEIPPTNEV